MWRYEQSTGKLFRSTPAGSAAAPWLLVGQGYSGHGPGVNNPALETQHDVGPIPQGLYEIGPAYNDSKRGPLVMRLTPLPGTDTFGRSGFLIHGDLVNAPGRDLASLGCIILAHEIRQLISDSPDRSLTVEAGG